MKTFISLVIAVALLDSSAGFAASSRSAGENAITAQLNQQQLSQQQPSQPPLLQQQAVMPQYDGHWILRAAGAGGRTSVEGGGGGTACSDFQIPLQIRNNQIVGTYSRSSSDPTEIVASATGSPMSGSVQPDGTFTMKWEAYNVAGKITGNALTATWRGQCGQRSATGTRIGS